MYVLYFIQRLKFSNHGRLTAIANRTKREVGTWILWMVTRLQIICILRTVLQNVFSVRTHFAASDTINAYFIIYGLFAYYLHEYLRTVLSTHAPCTDTYHVSTSIPRKYVGTPTPHFTSDFVNLSFISVYIMLLFKSSSMIHFLLRLCSGRL
jgi:hypothetical protein